ncbi:hypothetical protein [Nocardia nova]
MTTHNPEGTPTGGADATDKPDPFAAPVTPPRAHVPARGLGRTRGRRPQLDQLPPPRTGKTDDKAAGKGAKKGADKAAGPSPAESAATSDTSAERSAPSCTGAARPAVVKRPTPPKVGDGRTWEIPDYDDPDAAPAAPKVVDRSGGRRRSAVLVGRRGADGGGPESLTYRVGRGLGGVFVAVGVVAAIVAVVIAIVVINLHTNPMPRGAGPSAAVVSATAAGGGGPPHTTADCHDSHTDAATTGAGPGDTDSAPGAILAFEYAYYVQRSAAAARAVVAPDAAVPDAERIQTGIDAVPVGTRYCVRITAADIIAATTWNVDISEQWPTDQAPQVIALTVTTRRDGGHYAITAISNRK